PLCCGSVELTTPAFEQPHGPRLGSIEVLDQSLRRDLVQLDPGQLAKGITALAAQSLGFSRRRCQRAVELVLLAMQADNCALNALEGLPSGPHQPYARSLPGRYRSALEGHHVLDFHSSPALHAEFVAMHDPILAFVFGHRLVSLPGHTDTELANGLRLASHLIADRKG